MSPAGVTRRHAVPGCRPLRLGVPVWADGRREDVLPAAGEGLVLVLPGVMSL
jgi:hypothetical protein